MLKVLVVDDKEMMRDSVATILARKGYSTVAAASGKAALERMAKKRPDLVLTDLQMPGMSGLELLEAIRAIDEDVPVIIMTAYGSIENAVEAMRDGAYDYVTKPFSGDELTIAVARAIEHASLRRENEVLRASIGPATAPKTASKDQMVGSCKAMDALRGELDSIAASHGTVLISGESGTGKEVAAKVLHEASPRADKPFLAINCAALSESLLESELFGHEKGAFTGADVLRKGRFELADGGTLLLDEISEIPATLQAKLLRVLQEHSFERVGSSTTRSVDVRVIATTNRNLAKEVEEGRFRGDLFFRLNVLPVTLAPLRARPGDLEELASHFLAKIGKREGRPSKTFTADAFGVLRSYGWPGNIRELQNICERAAVLSPSTTIEASLIAPWVESVPNQAPHGALDLSGADRSPTTTEQSMVCDGEVKLEDIEREAILATLARNGGHRQKSARALGIGIRTLGLKLKKWKDMQIVEANV